LLRFVSTNYMDEKDLEDIGKEGIKDE